MKKTILFIAMALLCLNFTKAQQYKNAVQPINIGDKLPDSFWQQQQPVIQNGNTTLKNLTPYKGKLLILDFWASWCAPCIQMFSKTDSIERLFKGDVNFLPITYQKETEVKPFLTKFKAQTGLSITTLVDNSVLVKLFPHRTLPHYVWINATGIVVAITGYEVVTPAKVKAVIDGKAINLQTKTDEKLLDYTSEKPLMINGNGGDGNTLIYHAIVTTYTEGLSAGYEYNRLDTNSLLPRRVVARNLDLNWLYRLAYGEGIKYFGMNRMALEVKDPSKFIYIKSAQTDADWIKQNGFCYELIVPAKKAKSMFKMMQNDLATIFIEYDVKVEKRKTKCLTLIRTSTVDKLQSKGGKAAVAIDVFQCHLQNAYISHFFSRIDAFFLQDSPIPLVNATGYTGKVDFDINADMKNVESMNRALEKYDLKFVEQEHEVEMVVIKDRKI